MLGNNSQESNSKLYILKPKTQDAERKPVKPYFEISEKVEDKWKVTGETTSVSGELTQIVLGEREWEGNKIPTVKVVLEDKEKKEFYWLDLRYNILTRSFFNSILSLDKFDDVKVNIYQNKPKEGQTKSYANLSVRSHGEMVNWKYKLNELPPVEQVTVNKKVITDTTKIDEFFLKELSALAKKVKESKGKTKAKTEPQTSTPEVESDANPEEDGKF